MRVARCRVPRGLAVVGVLIVGVGAGAQSAWASPETAAYLGAQQRFTPDSQQLADRASVAVNVANGNLLVSGGDLQIAGRGLGLSLTRTYNGRGGGTVRTAGRDWVLSLGADNTLATESDGDRTWRGPTGEEYRFDRRTDGTFKSAAGANAALVVSTDGTAALTASRSGTVLSFSSASPGKLTRITDRNANHVDYAYGANGVSSITDTQGRSIGFAYWTSGDLKTITDPAGRTWSYGYDGNRRLTSYSDPEGKLWAYHYDASGRLDEITDPRSNKTQVGYDSTDRVTSLTRRVDGTSTNDVTTTYAYSGASSPCSTTLAGKTVVIDPRNKNTTYCVDADRQVVKALDALGRETSSTYTPNGDVSDFSQFGGTGAAAATAYSFSTSGTDPTNNLTGGTGGAGESFSLTYGSSGSDPLAKFRVASFTDAQGSDTFYGYDSNGNLTSVKDDQSAPFNQATMTYNTDGTIATATDGLSHQTTYSYDTAGNLASVTPPTTVGPGSPFDGTTYTHDGLSRVATVTDGRGEEQEFTYDKLDRITRIDYGDPVGEHFVTYAYDGNGNVTAQENDAALNLAYSYDKLNRRTADTLPETGFWNAYTYDKSSNLKTVTDQNQTVSYGYDDIDRVASITAPNADATGTETINYGYSDTTNPRTKTLTLPSGATERSEYDLSGKLTKVISKTSGDAVLRSRSYAFTEGSAQRELVQSVTDENQVKTTYTYKDSTSGDTGRLVKAVTRDAANALIAQYDYVYDKAGNRKTVQASPVLIGDQEIKPDPDTNPAGQAQAFRTTALASGSSAALKVYLDATNSAASVKVGLYAEVDGDPGSLLGQATIGSPTAGAWNSATFTGVAISKDERYWIAILQPTGTTGTIKYRSRFQDGDGALTSSQTSLSALPSSWSTGTVFGDDGPLAAYLTSSTKTTSFAYNNANQLCWSITGSSSAACGSPPSGATGYSYDGAGNQLTGDRDFSYGHLTQTQTIDPGPEEFGLEFLGADQTQLWNANNTRYQDNLLGLGAESSGERFVRDPDTGSVVSMTNDDIKRYFLHDRQDSTLALLSPSQKIGRSYSYDPDGNSGQLGDGPRSVIEWNRGINIENKGLYHFGARLYNPAIGRWTQPDPINQPADLTQANLYTYAAGDPINRADPGGTSAPSPCGNTRAARAYRRKYGTPSFCGNTGSKVDCALSLTGTAISVAGFFVPGPNALAAAGTSVGLASTARSC